MAYLKAGLPGSLSWYCRLAPFSVWLVQSMVYMHGAPEGWSAWILVLVLQAGSLQGVIGPYGGVHQLVDAQPYLEHSHKI